MSREPLEDLWDGLLSRDGTRILAVFTGLDKESQAQVLHHLQRMAGEQGWHPEQAASARAALAALKDILSSRE